jgi:uncharacterized membrane protein
MSVVGGKNKLVITAQAMLVVILLIIFFLSIPAFSNNYPAFGSLCLSVVGSVVFAWLLLAGHKHYILKAMLGICLLVALLSFAIGVPSEWQQIIG